MDFRGFCRIPQDPESGSLIKVIPEVPVPRPIRSQSFTKIDKELRAELTDKNSVRNRNKKNKNNNNNNKDL